MALSSTATKLLWAGAIGAGALAVTGIAIAATSKSAAPGPAPNPSPSPQPVPGQGCPPGTAWNTARNQCIQVGPWPPPQPQPAPGVDPWGDVKTKAGVLLLAVNTLKSIGVGLLSDPVRADGQFMYDTTQQMLAMGKPPPINAASLQSLALGNAQLQADNATVQAWTDQTALPPGTSQASGTVAAAGNDLLVAATSALPPATLPNV